MGLRGVGAGRRHKARAHLASNPRELPWQRPGLTRVARLIAFLEFLPVTKGRLEGRRMKLLPDQVAFVRAVYGPKGRKRVRLAIKSAPRGSGKTGLVAGLVLAHLVGPESEPRGEIYSAAIDREQAALVFHEVEAIVHAVPEFEAICNVVRHYKRVEVVEGPAAGSKYESLSADARRAHGLSPSLWVYDELAQAKTRALLDNLVTAAGKRKASLGIIISTQASDDTHPLSQLIDDAATGADPGVVSHVISAPEDADPFAEATVRACNPGRGRRSARPRRPDGGSRPGPPHPGLRAVLAQSAAQPALRSRRGGAAGVAGGLGSERRRGRRGGARRAAVLRRAGPERQARPDQPDAGVSRRRP